MESSRKKMGCMGEENLMAKLRFNYDVIEKSKRLRMSKIRSDPLQL